MKKLKKKSVVFQMFMITLVLLMILNAASILIIQCYFPQFYRSWKKDNIQRDLQVVLNDIRGQKIDFYDYRNLKAKFYMDYESKLSGKVGDKSIDQYLWDNQKIWRIRVQVKGKEKYIITPRLKVNDGVLKVGDKIFLGRSYGDNKYFGMLYISKYTNDYRDRAERESDTIHLVEVLDIREATAMERARGGFGEMNSDFDFFNGQKLVEKERISIKIKGKEEIQLLVEGNDSGIGVAVFLRIMGSFYKYIFIITAIVALILAGIFSKIITKPVIKIAEKSKRLAQLDFRENIEIRGKNELWELGENINILSSSLEEALDSLKNQLDIKIQQEKIRKEFVANVSHELKTPLSVMKCYVDILRDDISPEKKEEHFEIIQGEIRRMNKLVMEMLNLSSIESGDVTLHESIFNIKGVIQDACSLFQFQAEEKGVEIQIQGEFENVIGDVEKIEQVLINLISNAVKYSLEESAITINGTVSDGRNRIEIWNSCGDIEQEEAEKLFYRFHRLDKDRNDGGTGLGLSIAEAVLKLHESNYGITSRDGGIAIHFDLKIEG